MPPELGKINEICDSLQSSTRLLLEVVNVLTSSTGRLRGPPSEISHREIVALANFMQIFNLCSPIAHIHSLTEMQSEFIDSASSGQN